MDFTVTTSDAIECIKNLKKILYRWEVRFHYKKSVYYDYQQTDSRIYRRISLLQSREDY